jgi:hypothetical protein
MAQAVAICGPVNVDDDGTLCTYKKKCHHCGYVDPGTTRVQTPGRGSTLNSSNMCFKC